MLHPNPKYRYKRWNAAGWRDARSRRETDLRVIEGDETFKGQQRFLETAAIPAFPETTPKERQFVRATLVDCDDLMRSLGRPNREQVVTTRPDQLTTLQALDLANGQILTDTLKLIAQTRGTPMTLEQIPLQDPETYERVFHKGLTSGVFQF